MPTGDYEDEAAFRERMGLSPYRGISPYVAASDPYAGLLNDTADASGGTPFPSRVTYYAPGPGDKMEGPWATSQPNPLTGERIPSTLDDVRLGRSPFVTVASDPSRYGQKVDLGDLTYKSPIDGKTYTLPSVFGMVHDTGSAFRGRPDKLDVAAGDFRGWDPRQASAYVATDAGRRMVTPYPGGLTEEEIARAQRQTGNPVQAEDLPLAVPDGGGATDFSGQQRMPLGQAAAPGAPPGPPTGNLPFGIPGTFLNNPVQAALGDNFSTLLAFAGGARQGGIGQGLTQAAKASLIEGPQREAQKELSQQQFATYQALVANGLAPGLARAASLDPKLLAQVEKMAPQVVSRGKDILGRDQFVVRNPLTGQERPYEPGQSISGMGTTAAPAAGVSGTPQVQVQNNSQEIAKAIGVKNWAGVREDLPAEEYLAQFPKEFQAHVRNRVEGDTPFPANPRPGMESAASMVGERYAQLAGIPIDASTFQRRKDYLRDLYKTNPASVGGQKTGFNTMVQHQAEVTEAAVALNNANLGLTPLSRLLNSFKNQRGDQAEAVKALQTARGKYNAEVEKLYAGGQGSVTERQRDDMLISENASPLEIVGVMKAGKGLAQGRLNTLEESHNTILAPRVAAANPIVQPKTKEAYERTDKAIAQLRKQSEEGWSAQFQKIFGSPAAAPAAAPAPTAAPAAAAPVKITSKAEYDQLPKGTPYIAPDGSPRVKQ